MKKIPTYLAIITFVCANLSICGSGYAAEGVFIGCEYKASYRYYISKGDEYLAANQPESALKSYERALIIQPNSQEALSKIHRIKQLLKGGALYEPAAKETRRKAVERAIRIVQEMDTQRPASERRPPPPPAYRPTVYTPQGSRAAIARVKEEPQPKRAEPPPQKRPAATKVPSVARKPELSQRYPTAPSKKGPAEKIYQPTAYRPAGLNEFYDEYLDPVGFSNGINDKIQQGSDNINQGIAPSSVKGEYRLCFGMTSDDFIWKDANADYHNMPGDTSWRYIFGQDRHNSYDKKIYSRLNVDLDIPITGKIDWYNELIIDPWTYVGKKRVYVTGSGGDNVQMDLKYWSNVSRTINETYRTEKGDIVNVQENKVHDEKTSPETYRGLSDWGSNKFSVPEVEIDRMYVPLRKCWFDYKSEPYYAKLFFMANQDEALASDDPMRLSNNKIWWEESPWLDEYEPSRVFQRSAKSAPSAYGGLREPLKKGQWIRRQSFVAKDSDDQSLTFLRGASFDANFDNGTSVKMVAAAPRNLWDTYEQATSLPAALRIKSPVTEKLTLGGLYTFKGGFRHNSLEAMNNLVGVDGVYRLMPNTEISAEGAASKMDVDEASGLDNNYHGYAAIAGLKNSGSLGRAGNNKYKIDTAFAHMDDDFFPGLSNYRFTRKDFEYAKHIHFERLRPENEAVMVGDGMDVGRNTFKFGAKAEFPDQNVDARFDFRNVHTDGWDFLENAYRAEVEYRAAPKLRLKGLGYYLGLPKTTKGIDPLINAKNSYSAFTDYFAYEDTWLENTAIDAGLDPSIGAFSAGLNYDFCDYFSGTGIFEMTNDPKDWPRGLLNNVFVSDKFKDDIVFDKIVPFLYSQSGFGLPPYAYYGIYKASFDYYPFKPLKVTLSYVYNENKYAMAIDDNSTHQGVEIEYKPSSRLTLGFLYQYTRQNDMYKEFVLKRGNNYDGHHNIFAALDYDINEDQHFTLMFGEYVGYYYPYPEEHNSLAALDTRHIVRVVYSGSWGEPHSPRLDAACGTAPNPLGPFNPPIPGAKFITNLYGGQIEYKEKAVIAPVASKWDAPYGKLEFGIDAYYKEGLDGALRFGLFGSLTDQEKWDYEGLGDYQTNDTSIRGADVDFNIGWAFSAPSKYLSFTPLVNAGYRRIEFERSKLNMLGTPVPEIGEVGENFNVSYLGIGGRLDLLLAEKINLYSSGYWAPLVYAPVKNEQTGSLLADQGVIWHAEGGCDYNLSDRFDITLGGFWDQQHLDRAERINNGVVNAELPDNKLRTVGLKLGGSYKF